MRRGILKITVFVTISRTPCVGAQSSLELIGAPRRSFVGARTGVEVNGAQPSSASGRLAEADGPAEGDGRATGIGGGGG